LTSLTITTKDTSFHQLPCAQIPSRSVVLQLPRRRHVPRSSTSISSKTPSALAARKRATNFSHINNYYCRSLAAITNSIPHDSRIGGSCGCLYNAYCDQAIVGTPFDRTSAINQLYPFSHTSSIGICFHFKSDILRLQLGDGVATGLLHLSVAPRL